MKLNKFIRYNSLDYLVTSILQPCIRTLLEKHDQSRKNNESRHPDTGFLNGDISTAKMLQVSERVSEYGHTTTRPEIVADMLSQ